MVSLAVALRLLLPESPAAASGLTYRRLLQSLGGLVRSEPVLRQSCLFGALAFGAFSAFWTTLAFFLAGPPYHYGPDAVGLVGLVGVAGALAAPLAGRVADRHSPRLTIGLGLAAMLLSFLVLWLAGRSLAGLVVGVVLLDMGAQASHISNQTRIYSLAPEVRNRLNTVYMVAYFAGGAAGSALGSFAWERWDWGGVCACGALFLVAGLAVYFATAGPARRPSPAAARA